MLDERLKSVYLDPYFKFSDAFVYDSFAIITGWNPASRWLSKDKNRINNQQLRQEIDHTCYIEVLVGDKHFSWAEESFAVVVNRKQAIELGKRFGQNAIYYVEHDQLYLLSCLSDDFCQKIKQWRTRCR